MAGGAQNQDDDLITAINVTPLVDIVLVLLIILMVTANYIAQNTKTIPVDLPRGATGEDTNAPLSVTIQCGAASATAPCAPNGNLFLDGEPVNEAEFRRQVAVAYARNHDVRAVIAADGRVEHLRVVHAIDLLRQENVTKFAIRVQPEEVAH
ncbi:MAG: biopolymer transporter ExbD [Sandaracinaceae bacterium]|nr:biopolymer transporter ExbD [Sandaracinaceae bacterium]